MFRRMLEYKSVWHMKHLVVIDRWFPSSKLCSVCGRKYKDLGRDEREWVCPVCGAHQDRDGNASRNIRVEGLRLLRERGVFEPTVPGASTDSKDLNNKLAQGYGESQNGCGGRVRLPMGAALGEAARSRSL
jgi:transposase